MAFPVVGVAVDLSRSGERDVWLKRVERRTGGLFKCQVSVEGTFKSISTEKRLEVLDRVRPESLVGGPLLGGQQRLSGQQQQQQQQHLSISSNHQRPKSSGARLEARIQLVAAIALLSAFLTILIGTNQLKLCLKSH